jgi:hypothetical protein
MYIQPYQKGPQNWGELKLIMHMVPGKVGEWWVGGGGGGWIPRAGPARQAALYEGEIPHGFLYSFQLSTATRRICFTALEFINNFLIQTNPRDPRIPGFQQDFNRIYKQSCVCVDEILGFRRGNSPLAHAQESRRIWVEKTLQPWDFSTKPELRFFSESSHNSGLTVKNCTCPVLETRMYEGSMFLPTSA